MVTKEKIDALFNQLNDLKCQTQKQVEEARVRFLGRKGEITALFEEFRNGPVRGVPQRGQRYEKGVRPGPE